MSNAKACDFKVGDKVVCTNASEYCLLTVGNVYTVSWAASLSSALELVEVAGTWRSSRFQHYKSLEDAYDYCPPVWLSLPEPTRPAPPMPACKPSKSYDVPNGAGYNKGIHNLEDLHPKILPAFNDLTGQDLTNDQLQTLTILLKHFQV